MPRVTLQERRRLLLDAAWKVIGDRGFQGATTRAICEEAGMQQSVFHYCFVDRAELLSELIHDRLPNVMEVPLARIDRRGGLESAIRRPLTAVLERMITAPALEIRLFQFGAAAMLHKGPVASIDEITVWAHSSWRLILERIAEVRGITWSRPVEELCRTMNAIFIGIAYIYVLDHDERAAHQTLEAMVQVVLAAAVTSQ